MTGMRRLHSLAGRAAAALGLALCVASAQAAMGLAELPGREGDGPVTVFYPSAGPEATVQRGPFSLQLAPDAPPSPGNGRLVAISHGSGGNPWVHADLARVLVQHGYVVAMPRHRGDNALDPSTPGPQSWRQRPGEVSRAIDAVLADPRFAALDARHVGLYGMSAGGHTALVFAGGRWSPGAFRRHCEANLEADFAFCVGLATRLHHDAWDGLREWVVRQVLRLKFRDEAWLGHEDPRVAALVAGVPAAADFDMASLARPRVPLALVTARDDRWLVPRFHSTPVLAACLPRCEWLADIAGGHGALLSPPPPADRLGDIALDLLGDPPGFDRGAMHGIDEAIAGFFDRHLTRP